jgi:serine/threonine protein kinase
MGRVYRATQIRPVRTVAVKVVRPGVTAELAERRVENEATFLAKLQHPGIAQTSRPAPTRATLVTCRSS